MSRPSNARVEYRLAGFDADWIEGAVDRPIRYERLPAGTYALRLRSTDEQNLWDSGDQSLIIEVQPLLWERPWFRAAALAAAAGLAAAVAVGGATLRNRARLDGMSQIARQLVTSLDEMVWAVNPGNDTLFHLMSYLGQTASESLGRFGIACPTCRPGRPTSAAPAGLSPRSPAAPASLSMCLSLRNQFHDVTNHFQGIRRESICRKPKAGAGVGRGG